MRILFTFVGGRGHFEPLVPIARAVLRAGHTVAFTGRASMVSVVQSAGFSCTATNPESGAERRRLPLLEIDADREDRDLRERFARTAARERAAGILCLAQEVCADLIVCDEVDFGSMVAAERLDIPYASVQVIAAGSFVRREVVGSPLHELRVDHDLPPDPDLTMLSRYLVLSPIPPRFRDPLFPAPPTTHYVRTHGDHSIDQQVTHSWRTRLSPAPTVYFSLGTAFNVESGDLFSRVLVGLRELPINLIVTVGSDIDPAEFGVQPENVYIEQYIPQESLFPLCDLAISHGGSGSVMGALRHGVPMVLLPMGADQPHNADRCTTLGLGRVLDPLHATPENVRDAVVAVLEDPRYRSAARSMKAEFAALPGPGYAVTLLERLAAEHRPLHTDSSRAGTISPL